MSETSLVFGRITTVGTEAESIMHHNLSRIQAYNFAESTWFSANMFSHNVQTGKDSVTLAFGRSYKNIEHQWNSWTNELEQLLGVLQWDSVHLVLETEMWGSQLYRWWANTKARSRWNSDFCTKHHIYNSGKWFRAVGLRNVWGMLQQTELPDFLDNTIR